MKTFASKLVPRWSIEDAVTAAFVGALSRNVHSHFASLYSVTQFLESTRW